MTWQVGFDGACKGPIGQHYQHDGPRFLVKLWYADTKSPALPQVPSTLGIKVL